MACRKTNVLLSAFEKRRLYLAIGIWRKKMSTCEEGEVCWSGVINIAKIPFLTEDQARTLYSRYKEKRGFDNLAGLDRYLAGKGLSGCRNPKDIENGVLREKLEKIYDAGHVGTDIAKEEAMKMLYNEHRRRIEARIMNNDNLVPMFGQIPKPLFCMLADGQGRILWDEQFLKDVKSILEKNEFDNLAQRSPSHWRNFLKDNKRNGQSLLHSFVAYAAFNLKDLNYNRKKTILDLATKRVSDRLIAIAIFYNYLANTMFNAFWTPDDLGFTIDGLLSSFTLNPLSRSKEELIAFFMDELFNSMAPDDFFNADPSAIFFVRYRVLSVSEDNPDLESLKFELFGREGLIHEETNAPKLDEDTDNWN